MTTIIIIVLVGLEMGVAVVLSSAWPPQKSFTMNESNEWFKGGPCRAWVFFSFTLSGFAHFYQYPLSVECKISQLNTIKWK